MGGPRRRVAPSAHLEELLDEKLDALDSGVVAAIDLGRLPGGLLDEQADERVAPVAELHRVALALAGVVVGGLYGLIVRHILDHSTGAGDSGGSHRTARSISLSLTRTHTRRTRTLLILPLSRSQMGTSILSLAQPARIPRGRCGARVNRRVSVTRGLSLRHRRPSLPPVGAAPAYTCALRRAGAARRTGRGGGRP